MYDRTDDVIELTASNFDNTVTNSDSVSLVLFYAPWSGHCQSLAPEWKKVATALRGIVQIGAVDMDVHGSVGGPYNVRGLPTIKIFAGDPGDPRNPVDYNDSRTAAAIVDAALEAATRLASNRLMGVGSGSTSTTGGGEVVDHVVEVTDSNVDQEVFGQEQPVLVEFFAPWSGHCQSLAPEWKKAAAELSGQVKLAAVDATVHTVTASRFQVQGYPTIKVIRPGSSTEADAEDYQGGRTASDIIAYGLDLAAQNMPAPERVELVSAEVLAEHCLDKPLGVITFFPAGQSAASREEQQAWLRALGDKYKSKGWGWLWAEMGRQPGLEQALGVSGSGPALVVVNPMRKFYVALAGELSFAGVDELLKSVAVGRGATQTLTADLSTVVG